MVKYLTIFKRIYVDSNCIVTNVMKKIAEDMVF